jgi:molecular chaperone DnaK
MSRTTIDYGIDLGTTNSCIALLNGTDTDIIDNNYQAKLTPSAVWMDGKCRLHVGQKAKERLEDDPGNAFSEFKLQMGTSHFWTFQNSGTEVRPEELSAEVLKSLRGDVEQQKGEVMNAAIITVPADFDLPENAATQRAAQLAGFSYVQLVQEPVAAALAYGFQSDSDKVFWLVYDLGGGTFDAAIVQMRDGIIRVVNHGGDKNLGGKQIDRDIVNNILVPAIAKQGYALPDFKKGNRRWLTAFAKLKAAAEDAKIQLSRRNTASIVIPELCKDEQGNAVYFEYDLKRSDIEPFIEPYVERSINICQKVLEEKRLGTENIEKIIVVGGPTLTPLLRDMLSSRMGIPLDYSIDPLTVVARGAAIFAGTQRQETTLPEPSSGQFTLDTPHQPVGVESEPKIGGRVIAPDNRDLTGFTIEFVELKSMWRSGIINLRPNGSFSTELRAEQKRMNEYLIELRDAVGNLQEIVPDRIHYTIGSTMSNPILTHSVGVATANNEMQVFISKGTPLPRSSRQRHYTTTEVKRGDPNTRLRIPVVEGENTKRANRNRLIGSLEINGAQVRRDIPVNTDVEIKITITESLEVRAEAFIPILEQVVDKVLVLVKEAPDLDVLEQEINKEKERLGGIAGRSRSTNDQHSEIILQRIRYEQTVDHIENALTAARDGDPDAPHECLNRLHELQTSIDEIEDNLAWPLMVEEAQEEMQRARNIAEEYGDDNSRHRLKTLEQEAHKAISIQDRDLLQRKMEEISTIINQLLLARPEYWVFLLEQLEEMKGQMTNPSLAERLIMEGKRALNSNNLDGLKNCIRQLVDLLPREQQEAFGDTMPRGL